MHVAGLIETVIAQPSVQNRRSEVDTLPKPFVKWAGGKRQLLNILNASAPSSFGRYFEPFVGGGALLFSRLPESATISDANEELINCYRVIKDDVDSLIKHLRTRRNDEEYFYKVRAMNLNRMTAVSRASRFIYLNKTCFNGLYRENQKGQFNVPFGRYDNPKIVDEQNLLAISDYLKQADVEILCTGYKKALNEAVKGDFVYCDPPYVAMSKTASFAHYLKGGFSLDDQAELAEVVKELTRRGVKVMLSNSNTEVIHELYRDFNLQRIHATRSINCKASGRGKDANEVLITNY